MMCGDILPDTWSWTCECGAVNDEEGHGCFVESRECYACEREYDNFGNRIKEK